MAIEPVPKGKLRLMEAALKLNMTARSLTSLTIRELAREADLNPNTFYRHFKNLDDLGLFIIDHIEVKLRIPLREIRQKAAMEQVAVEPDTEINLQAQMQRTNVVLAETVRLFYDFVANHKEAFITGVCETNGASPILRKSMANIMQGFADDLFQDARDSLLAPQLDDKELAQLSNFIIHHQFQMSIKYIENPTKKAALIKQSYAELRIIVIGAVTQKQFN